MTAKTVTPILRKQMFERARLMTDESSVYTKIGREFAQHGAVNHSVGEYADGDTPPTPVESSFASLKRGLYGTFHHISKKHLQRCATEFDFRWNTRVKFGFSDADRADAALRGISGKRLTYKILNPE